MEKPAGVALVVVARAVFGGCACVGLGRSPQSRGAPSGALGVKRILFRSFSESPTLAAPTARPDLRPFLRSLPFANDIVGISK